MTDSEARSIANVVLVAAGLAAAYVVITTPPLRRLVANGIRWWLGAAVPAYLTAQVVDAWVQSGSIPVVKSAKEKLASVSDKNDAAWLNFVYDTSSNAKSFAQSWDQALSPTAAETLLDNIAKLFQLSISPQQFADSMNAVIGK